MENENLDSQSSFENEIENENSDSQSSIPAAAEQSGVDTDFVDSAEDGASDDQAISFADLGLNEKTLAAIAKKGFVTPSPIQVLAIPRLLNGDANVIAKARTGTGKTAAFGLPLVQKIDSCSDHVKAIILEPTRELAMQTAVEMASFTTGGYPRSCVVYGGASMGAQIRDLKRGVEIVVGTPGRVQDLMDRGVLDISKIEYFILDEGDEMLDMGFVEDIEKIFSAAPDTCRVLLFSATMPAPILKIASKFMGEYEIIEEENHEEAPLLIEQKFWFVRESEKVEALVRLIDISPDFYGLVFTQKKTDADYVCKALDEKGYDVAALHGDIPQGQREKILARFRAKRIRVLVATDVAARGIDIGGLTHVVNYELPFDGPTYVHRIGRTGRAGSAGMAVTFVRPEERRRLGYLQQAVRKSAKGEMNEGKVPSVDEVIEAKKTRLFDDVRRKLFVEAVEKSDEKPAGQSVEPAVEQSSGMESAVNENADTSNVSLPEQNGAPENTQAQDTENEVVQENTSASAPVLRKGDSIFDALAAELCEGQNPQEVLATLLAATYGREISRKRYGKLNEVAVRGGRDGGRGDRRGRDRDARVGEGQMRLYVQMGWHDKQNPKSIAEFFSKLLHIPNRLVDRIDMADKFCLLNLPEDAARKALAMSESDKSLPHMHADTKVSAGGGSGKRFGGENRDRYAVGRRDGGHGERRGGDRNRSGSSRDGRKNRSSFHAPTERNSNASLYKKSGKSSSAKEY